MKRTFTLFVFLFMSFGLTLHLSAQGLDCPTCDPANPTFTLEVVPSVGLSGGNVTSGRFDVSLRNNTASPLNLVTMDLSVGINSAALSSLVSANSDATNWPNIGVPIPPNIEFITDLLSAQTTMLNGQTYDQYYEYDHTVAGAIPPVAIPAGNTVLVASMFFTFDGTQSFTAADMCNSGFMAVFPGNCIAVDPNVNNQYGFTAPTSLVNCFTVECMPPVVLPLELTDFSGAVMDRHNELYWTTATETNTLVHFIERTPSPGNIPYETIGQMDAAGNSELPLDYIFKDENPLRVGYYRLKTESFDGSIEYSEVVFLERHDAAGVLATFPNPTTDKFFVQLSIEENSVLEFDVIDVFGRVVKSFVQHEGEGILIVEVDFSSFGNGMYYIRLRDGLATGIIPVVKKAP
ncbi:MAG: T9SS type A sorting domain-containing protein [Bacteroidota bacterium]